DVRVKVRGTITARDQVTPLPGAVVAVAPEWISATTDAQGRYELDDVPEGVHTLYASFSGYSSASTSRGVNFTDLENVEDVSLGVSILRGQVTDGTNAVSDARVEACGGTYMPPYAAICISTTADASGRYVFLGLPGWYRYQNPFDGTIS